MKLWDGEHLLQRLHEPGSALHLAVVRLLLGAYLIYVYASPAFDFLLELDPDPRSYTYSWIPRTLEDAVAPWVGTLRYVALGSSITFFLGIATRASTAVLLVSMFFLQNTMFRVTCSHLEWPYWLFPLTIFLFSPIADRLSVDAWIRSPPRRPAQAYRWPIEVCILWVTILYFAAGIAKTFPLRAGAQWIQGEHVHKIAATFYFDSPAVWMLGQAPMPYDQDWPFMLGSVAAVFIELATIFIVLQRRWNLLLFGSVLAFHVTWYLMTGVQGFLYAAVLCTPFFFKPEWFSDFPHRR